MKETNVVPVFRHEWKHLITWEDLLVLRARLKAVAKADVHTVDGKYHIQRSKGLGENEPEMMWQKTMNPKSRKLVQVLPEDVEKTKEMFEMLLGDNLKGRKEYIEQNGYKYIDLTDV